MCEGLQHDYHGCDSMSILACLAWSPPGCCRERLQVLHEFRANLIKLLFCVFINDCHNVMKYNFIVFNCTMTTNFGFKWILIACEGIVWKWIYRVKIKRIMKHQVANAILIFAHLFWICQCQLNLNLNAWVIRFFARLLLVGCFTQTKPCILRNL